MQRPYFVQSIDPLESMLSLQYSKITGKGTPMGQLDLPMPFARIVTGMFFQNEAPDEQYVGINTEVTIHDRFMFLPGDIFKQSKYLSPTSLAKLKPNEARELALPGLTFNQSSKIHLAVDQQQPFFKVSLYSQQMFSSCRPEIRGFGEEWELDIFNKGLSRYIAWVNEAINSTMIDIEKGYASCSDVRSIFPGFALPKKAQKIELKSPRVMCPEVSIHPN